MTIDTLRAVAYTAEDVDVTVRTAWGESRGEPLACQIGVIWVIRNRVELGGWWGTAPTDVCRKPFQFSCWGLLDPNYAKLKALGTTDPEYLHFQVLVLNVFRGIVLDPTCGGTTYKRTGTAASWDKAVDTSPPIVLGHQSFWRLAPNGKVLPFLKPPAELTAGKVPEASERAVPPPVTPQPHEAHMSKFLPFILARLQEPSTYAGLGGIALAFGLHLSGDQLGAVTSVLVAGAGAASAFLPEGK